MAVTNIVPIHKGTTSIQKFIKKKIDYITDRNKTENKTLVSSYMCDPDIADKQFTISKQSYLRNTGRIQKNDVIAYRVMQSFFLDEVTPEKANEIGTKLSEELTKGEHAFVVATHVNTDNIHNHIIWNSTNLDCDAKWRNFWGTDKEVARVSDLLCLQSGLSVIEEKSDIKEFNSYADWEEENIGKRKPTYKELLRQVIDEVLEQKPQNIDEFIKMVISKGYDYKRGKHLAFRKKGQKKFTRLGSLGEEYSEEKIIEKISLYSDEPITKQKEFKKEKEINQEVKEESTSEKSENDISLLLDLHKIKMQGRGAGYERWAKRFNTNQLAKTMSFINENGLTNYKSLKIESDKILNQQEQLKNNIRDINMELKIIREEQSVIINYSKTKSVFEQYRKTGYSEKFKQEHLEEILMHREAKKVFDEYDGNFPKMADLKQRYATLNVDKKKMYSEINQLRYGYKDLLIAKENVDLLLNKNNDEQKREEVLKKTVKKKIETR